MTRPSAPDIPCGGGGRCRTERNGGEGRNRIGQLAPGVSYPRWLTIYSTNDIPNRAPWTGRSPRPAPCGPAGPRVPTHAHDNLYPSTSSTPPASNLGRRRNQENSHRASTRFSGVDPNSLEVARSQRSRGYQPLLASSVPRRPARASFTFTLLLSRTHDVTVKLHSRSSVTLLRAWHANLLARWRSGTARIAKRPEPD